METARQTGLEPVTLRLTAELINNIILFEILINV